MKPTAVAIAAHFVFWAVVVKRDATPSDWLCSETSCWVLLAGDLPASLLYIAGDHVIVSIGSLVLGAMWWGFIAFAMAKWAKGPV